MISTHFFERNLFKQIDNSALVVFRMCFGFLITCEAWGAIATGWVKRVFVEPQFTFNFIGFDFLQPLPGDGMYYYFGLMGIFGVFVMIGLKYRWSMLAYAVMWACVYLMQKSSYNNHYYLLMLLNFIMCFLPASRYASIDVLLKPSFKKISMPRWVLVFIILQLWIVYTYAALAKLYPDWLDSSVPGILMKARADYWLIGDVLQEPWIHKIIAYVGIFFDLLIIPALLYKRTRTFAFVVSIFFHLFNSIIFQIGIFPYLSLAFTLFFFPSELIHRLFLRRKPYYEEEKIIVPPYKNLFIAALSVWFIIQVALPSRHWFFTDNVLWTEEGHRLSWRMMLRSKSGSSSFKIVNKTTGKETYVRKRDYLSPKQLRSINTKPDFIWQFAQRLKEEYAEKGEEIEVYVRARVSVNGRKSQILIDPTVDMAAAPYYHFKHNPWILPSKLD
ncbi:HTTM domain-containing protein [Gangjinia marincola]|uniref:HTTM domain-containing protein n=1 Tax=Gangjinia marincola TaxID=578463 RepID=A0ABN1MIA0_9FLAO